MNSREFCYWMQSLFEVADMKVFDEKQTNQIRCHLQLVFAHEIDLSYPTPPEVRQDIHDGVVKPIVDPLKSLTPEELASIPPLTAEQLSEIANEIKRPVHHYPRGDFGGGRRISC